MRKFYITILWNEQKRALLSCSALVLRLSHCFTGLNGKINQIYSLGVLRILFAELDRELECCYLFF